MFKIIAQAILDFVNRGPSEKLGGGGRNTRGAVALDIPQNRARDSSLEEVAVVKFSDFMAGRWLWQGITGSKVKSG